MTARYCIDPLKMLAKLLGLSTTDGHAILLRVRELLYERDTLRAECERMTAQLAGLR